jgi:beta-lactamase class A
LINPLLECDIESPQRKKELIIIEHKLEEKVEQMKQRHNISEMAVYLRDLNNGPWLGIDENKKFAPASLLKIPVMIAYYAEAERNPSILNQKVVYTDTTNLNANENIKPNNAIEKGKEYTINELIRRMIVYSDNDAMALLVEKLPLSIQDKVYQDLGLSIPGARTLEDFMTVKEYASFFRILYNASYLSKEYSQKALELLSEVDFANGIRAGVPSKIRVANKFGERNFQGRKQLHDCGIVYYPNNPYLLCIMSRGDDFSEMAQSIRDVSALVYRDFDILYR